MKLGRFDITFDLGFRTYSWDQRGLRLGLDISTYQDWDLPYWEWRAYFEIGAGFVEPEERFFDRTYDIAVPGKEYPIGFRFWWFDVLWAGDVDLIRWNGEGQIVSP